MEDQVYLEITDGSDIIKIEPLRWTHPNSEYDWDRNWIRSAITVKGGAFHGKFICDLFTSDFELFKRALKKAYDDLKSTVVFKTMEGQVEINCIGDGLGHFEVNCRTMDEAGIGNELNIKMTIDQTAIPALIRHLDKITKTFPIQGTELKLVNE